MRWLVTGSRGMLGQDALAVLRDAGQEVTATDRDDLDICDEGAVEAAVAGHDVVLNCAAWTAVDDAETREGAAFRVNAVGPAVLARAAHRHGARIVQISTDYVLAGDTAEPAGEDAQRDPRSAYGRTKAAGEWAVAAEAPDHLIVRTAWLYGANGPCFPRTIARVGRERGRLEVVDDQTGQPTWTVDVASLVLRLVDGRAPSGVYHATSSGRTTWFAFARAVVAAAGLDPAIVHPIPTDGSDRPAPRPAFSALGHERLRAAGIAPIGDWADRWAAAHAVVLGG